MASTSPLTLEKRMEMFNSLISRASLDSKSFQHDGLKWCLERELNLETETETDSSKVKGGIIADEMGLGKTILMIGLIYSHFVSRTLIVLPVALVKQWHQTILRLTGHSALVYYGKDRKKITKTMLRSAPIVITTYNIATLCAFDKKSLLHTTKWGRIIYDEAHHLRNSCTIRHVGCAALQTNITWVVSGTPIQNKPKDLFSLCSIIGIKITATDFKNAQAKSEFLKKYVLKRTKTQVGIILPPLNIITVKVAWSNPVEKHMSSDIHHSLSFSNIHCNKRQSMKQAFSKQIPLILLLRARQSCVMPMLMAEKLYSMHKDGEVKFNKSHMNAVLANSKINAVVDMVVANKNNGTGKLIFCHYIKEIDVIKCKLLAAGIQKVSTYDGRNSRNSNVLTDPADVLILQIQTGCEGLNLQEHYSEIYFVSPHWNPSIEDQAIARCYRIGQNKPVNVYKYIMNNFDTHPDIDGLKEKKEEKNQKNNDDDDDRTYTIEDYVNIVQNRKRTLISLMLEPEPDELLIAAKKLISN